MTADPDEQIPPDWLNKEFLERTLKKHNNDELVEVLHYEIHPGSSVGDHFASIMFRIVLNTNDVNCSKMSLIIKTTPFMEGVKKDFISKTTMFEVEIKMYAEVLPRMEKLLQKCGIRAFWPKTIHQGFEPVPLVILEDLSTKGYTVPTRVVSLASARATFSRIAQFHAVSYFMHREQSFDFSEFTVGLFQIPHNFTKNFFDQHLDLFMEEITKWEDYEMYEEKFREFRLCYFEKGKRETQCVAGGYNVLNHGDLHNKNLLIRAAEASKTLGGGIDLILLDYQMCLWSSPAVDIIYSLYTLMDSETRGNHRNELIKHYYHSFSSVLKQLDFQEQMPTYEQLQVELKRFGFLEVVLSIGFLPFQFIDTKLIEDIAKLFGKEEESNELKQQMMSNPDFKLAIQKELPRFLEMGFIDV